MSKWINTIFQSQLRATLLLFSVIVFALSIWIGIKPDSIFAEYAKQFIFIYLAFTVIRALFLFIGANIDKYKHDKLRLNTNRNYHPMITILVPGYNEEKVIRRTIQNLSKLDYENYEILVIDDGSSDKTKAIAEATAFESSSVTVRVISQQNAGKANALNLGMRHALGELVLCVDADSIIHPKTLREGVIHFLDSDVGAVAGFVEIADKNSHLLWCQQLEYLLGLNFVRRALSISGAVPIVPGPIGLFRKKAIFEVGGYYKKEKMFAEDAELALRVLAKGWRIKSEENMIAYTEGPQDIMALLRQRYRWNRGTFQALSMNIFRMLGSPYKRSKLICLHLIGETYFVPIINFGFTLMFLSHFLVSARIDLFTTWFFQVFAIDALTTLLVTHRHKGVFRWLYILAVSKFTYGYILDTWKVICMFEEFFDNKMSWDKLERTGIQATEVT